MTIFLVAALGYAGGLACLTGQFWVILAATVLAAVIDVYFPRNWKGKTLTVSPALAAFTVGVWASFAIVNAPMLFSPVIGFAAGYLLSKIIRSSSS